MGDENSGVRLVKSTPDELQELGVDQLVANKSGFLYFYTSNEVEQDVFIDNVTVAVASWPFVGRDPLLSVWTGMAVISSNALKGHNYLGNRKKYNGIEYTGELDINQYDASLRTFDPQLGDSCK